MSGEYILQVPLALETKTAAEEIYRRIGVSLTEAVQIFTRRSVEMNAAPFPMQPIKSARGIAKKYANPKLIPLEEKAFERAAVEKYENAY